MQTTITVFIADNQMMYKLGLKTVLQAFPIIKLVGNTEFKENWLNDIAEAKPDVVLIYLESESAEITKHIFESFTGNSSDFFILPNYTSVDVSVTRSGNHGLCFQTSQGNRNYGVYSNLLCTQTLFLQNQRRVFKLYSDP